MKRLLLVRHGETSANIDQVWHGSTDTPLSDQGEHQRELLGKRFSDLYMQNLDLVAASPLQRAKLTAQAIAAPHGIEVKSIPALQEYCLGEWEGYPFSQLKDETRLFHALRHDDEFRSPGGETRREVTKRVVDAIQAAWNHSANNVVIVSHGFALSFALAHLMSGDSSNWLSYAMDNTAVTELDLERRHIVSFNQTSHLEEAGKQARDSQLIDKMRQLTH